MSKLEIELLTQLIKTESESSRIQMEDVRRTIAVAAAHTDGRLCELNKTIGYQNGRLKVCESELEKQKKITAIVKWAGKYWYITLGGIVLILIILIPLVELLGLKGIISLIK